MRKFCIILAILLYAINLFSQESPGKWYTCADTTWATSKSNMVVTITVGNSINMATAKKIALSKSSNLAIKFFGKKVVDTLTTATGETIIQTTSSTSATARIMDEKLFQADKLFQEKDGTYSYYLMIIVAIKN